jgi:hypothetical protein
MGDDGNPSIEKDNHLKAAEEFFELARTTTNPFMRRIMRPSPCGTFRLRGNLSR